MKLVSMSIVHNEVDRYLPLWLPHLLDFVDEVRIIDDGSTDSTSDFLQQAALEEPRVQVERLPVCQMFEHEGRARNLLLDFAMVGRPTVLLAIDADEFVTDPQAVRHAAEQELPNVWTLDMEEVWKADPSNLYTRQDGGWGTHKVPIMFRVPRQRVRRQWAIRDKQLACGREPVAVRQHFRKAVATGSSVLHFGWLREAERKARYDRYVEKDGGRFHASAHLHSIMFPDRQVRLKRRPWPEGLGELRGRETAA